MTSLDVERVFANGRISHSVAWERLVEGVCREDEGSVAIEGKERGRKGKRMKWKEDEVERGGEGGEG